MNGDEIGSMMSENEAVAATGRKAAVVGMFDGVHPGHRHLFGQLFDHCRKRRLSPVVFTFPKHPLEVVNPAAAPKLLSEPEEKLRLLKQCGFGMEQVEFMVFDSQLRNLSAREFIAMLRHRYGVDVILRGFNNRFGTERHFTPDDYRRIGRAEGVEIIDATEYRYSIDGLDLRPSSSEIRGLLAEGDVDSANNMLGYPYPLSGRVVAGKQLGRQLGFPTANIEPLHPSKLIPADGVYICSAIVNQPVAEPLSRRFRAMVNVGTRPTVDGVNHFRTIEAHILDFTSDLYDTSLTLEFHHRLRLEIRFQTLDQLRDQLAADRDAVINYFRFRE